jgi:hypothetical protein
MTTSIKNTILCVWRATLLETNQIGQFEEWLKTEFGATGKFVETVTTLPSAGEEGGRKDVLFTVLQSDVPSFAVKRLAYGISWFSDYVANEGHIIPQDVSDRYEGE